MTNWIRIWAVMRHGVQCLQSFIKWILISVFTGVLVGLTGTAFAYSMAFVTNFRFSHPAIIFGLPAGGLLIVGMYKLLKDENDTGTNMVLSSIRSNGRIPFRMAPCIFISTVITHLFGGSAGREGAALQLGGSIGSTIGTFLHLDEKDQHVITMCGMSAAFSALFGTPLAAAIFPMEVVSVGIMQYAALVPCVVASLIAHGIASYFGLEPEFFGFTDIPAFSLTSGCIVGLLAILCALVSILFCIVLHNTSHMSGHLFKNPYIRAMVGGCAIVALTCLVGNQQYNGAGMNFIEAFFREKSVFPAAFLLKILFTAITLGSGFKGGEIVPTFYIGASFGCLFGMVSGFSVNLCTAVGMAAVFCGVTNSPITSLLISFELFGYDAMPYYLLAIAISYMLSGYFGLYSSQKIMYSKFKTHYIDRKAY